MVQIIVRKRKASKNKLKKHDFAFNVQTCLSLWRGHNDPVSVDTLVITLVNQSRDSHVLKWRTSWKTWKAWSVIYFVKSKEHRVSRIVLCVISLVLYVLLCSLALNLFVFGFELLSHFASSQRKLWWSSFFFVDSSVVCFHQCFNLVGKRKGKHPSFSSLSLLRQTKNKQLLELICCSSCLFIWLNFFGNCSLFFLTCSLSDSLLLRFSSSRLSRLGNWISSVNLFV